MAHIISADSFQQTEWNLYSLDGTDAQKYVGICFSKCNVHLWQSTLGTKMFVWTHPLLSELGYKADFRVVKCKRFSSGFVGDPVKKYLPN